LFIVELLVGTADVVHKLKKLVSEFMSA